MRKLNEIMTELGQGVALVSPGFGRREPAAASRLRVAAGGQFGSLFPPMRRMRLKALPIASVLRSLPPRWLNRGKRPGKWGRRRNRSLAALFSLLVCLAPLGALAQITEPLLPLPALPSGPQAPVAPGQPTFAGQSVAQRSRPEFEPLGLHIGDFFWFPRAELDEAYNSNIFALPNPTYDLITSLQPSFDLLSSFPRNSLNLHGGSLVQFFADHPAQDTQDGFINADGRLDLATGSAVYGSAQVAHSHLFYGTPNLPGNVAQPVTYNDYRATAGYSQGGRRFSYRADVAIDYAQYNAVPLIGGGILPQSAQNTIISEAALRGSYEVLPDYLGYLRVAGDFYDYPHTVPDGVRFNSTIYRADLGLEILPRHIVYGEIYAGYLFQNFVLTSLGSTSTPDAGARLVWDVTRLTTFTLSGLRVFVPVNPTIGTIGHGYLDSVITVSGDHELLRNLLINATGSYENSTFQGATRIDNIFTAGLGLRYLVNRNFFLGGTYTYQQRNSTARGASYTQNIGLLRIGTQF